MKPFTASQPPILVTSQIWQPLAEWDDPYQEFLYKADIAFNIFFTVEIACKVRPRSGAGGEMRVAGLHE